MPTIGDSVTRAKRLLHSNTRTEFDALDAAVLVGATTINLKYQTDGIRAGSYISVGDTTQGFETMYVHSRNGEYATVMRAVDGSAAVAFTTGTLIEVEPRFTGHQILEAVRDAVRSLPPNLYGISTLETTVTTTGSAVNFDLSSTGYLHVLQAVRSPRSQRDRWIKANVKIYEHPADLLDSNSTDFASGYSLVVQEGLEKDVTIRVTYAHPFVDGTLDLDTDLVTTVKMQSQMQDIPALGAAASLMLADESTRLDLHAKGDSRGDAALNAGDRTQYSRNLQFQFDRRVSQEARRLMALYGVRADGATSSVFPTTIR